MQGITTKHSPNEFFEKYALQAKRPMKIVGNFVKTRCKMERRQFASCHHLRIIGSIVGVIWYGVILS